MADWVAGKSNQRKAEEIQLTPTEATEESEVLCTFQGLKFARSMSSERIKCDVEMVEKRHKENTAVCMRVHYKGFLWSQKSEEHNITAESMRCILHKTGSDSLMLLFREGDTNVFKLFCAPTQRHIEDLNKIKNVLCDKVGITCYYLNEWRIRHYNGANITETNGEDTVNILCIAGKCISISCMSKHNRSVLKCTHWACLDHGKYDILDDASQSSVRLSFKQTTNGHEEKCDVNMKSDDYANIVIDLECDSSDAQQVKRCHSSGRQIHNAPNTRTESPCCPVKRTVRSNCKSKYVQVLLDETFEKPQYVNMRPPRPPKSNNRKPQSRKPLPVPPHSSNTSTELSNETAEYGLRNRGTYVDGQCDVKSEQRKVKTAPERKSEPASLEDTLYRVLGRKEACMRNELALSASVRRKLSCKLCGLLLHDGVQHAGWQALAAEIGMEFGDVRLIEDIVEQHHIRTAAPDIILYHWQALYSDSPDQCAVPCTKAALRNILTNLGGFDDLIAELADSKDS